MTWQDGFAFDLGEELLMVRDTARAFAEGEVLPLAAKTDHDHYYPRDLVARMGQLGFMGAMVPAKYGGSELPAVDRIRAG